MRPLLPLLCLALLPMASAQVSASLRQTATQPFPELKLNLKNVGKIPARLPNWSASGPNCYRFNIISKTTGKEIPQPVSDCAVSNSLTLAPGQSVNYLLKVGVDLPAGEYRFTLPLNVPGKLGDATTLVRVGPGPFFASLALSAPAKAGRPVPLVTEYRNVWPTTQGEDVRPCGRGLQIRNVNGRVVYDTLPEKAACITNLVLTTLEPGQMHAEPWPRLPALPAGDYTAVMWGSHHASLRFTVKK